MARRASNPFPSVRTEGGLLPAETLQRIAAGEAAAGNRNALSALTPASYHLPPGERLNEAISRSWSRLVAAWASLAAASAKLPESDAGTTLTRERWLLPLIAELGYGRLPTTKPLPAGNRDYAVGRLPPGRADREVGARHEPGGRNVPGGWHRTPRVRRDRGRRRGDVPGAGRPVAG